MGDCGVCLYVDNDDYEGAIDDAAIVTLSEQRLCSECSVIVPAGCQMEEATWHEDEDLDEDGEIYPEHGSGITVEGVSGLNLDYVANTWPSQEKEAIYTCLVCAEIANAFYCGGDGRIYGGGLWDSLHEVMGELNSSCFDRLTTPEAKAELRRRWMAWKGLTA